VGCSNKYNYELCGECIGTSVLLKVGERSWGLLKLVGVCSSLNRQKQFYDVFANVDLVELKDR
jgi:hypothetical protein